MDRTAIEMLGSVETQVSPRRQRWNRATVLKLGTSAAPWCIIGGLLWAGLFIKPQPVGSTVQPPVMERRDHYYAAAIPSADRMWFAGSGGKIVSVGHSGPAELLNTPTDKTLQDMALWDSQRGIAVGNDGVVLLTADGGKSWTAAGQVPRSQVANKLNRVRVAEGGLAVATGEMGALLASRDYGATWERLRPEEDVAWNDVALLPGGRMVAVGEFGRIVVSGDGGSTWSDVKGPVQSSLMAVSFRDERHGVAAGLEGAVLLTRDGGQHWEKLDLGPHDHLFDIAWDAAGQRWIGAGSLGRWVSISADGASRSTGRLDERDLSWHTRVLPAGQEIWFAGANVGRWDGSHWQPIADAKATPAPVKANPEKTP